MSKEITECKKIEENTYSISISEKDMNIIQKHFSNNEEKLIEAAFEDFICFLSEPRKFSKFSDYQLYRLYLLIKKTSSIKTLTEKDVRSIFKTETLNSAKNMITKVYSIYSEEIDIYREKSVKDLFVSTSWSFDEDNYEFTCETPFLISIINDILQNESLDTCKVVIKKGFLCKYQIKPHEFSLINEKLFKTDLKSILDYATLEKKNSYKICNVYPNIRKYIDTILEKNRFDLIISDEVYPNEFSIKKDAYDYLKGICE